MREIIGLSPVSQITQTYQLTIHPIPAHPIPTHH